MKRFSLSWKGPVPDSMLLLILIAMYSFAPAHHPPSLTHLNADLNHAVDETDMTLRQVQGDQPEETITGTVYDAAGPMMDVAVSIKGTGIVTYTDENGNYAIDASMGDVLIFAFPGYETLEITVTNQTLIDVELTQSITQLEEAVINAGYYTVKDKERTGNILKITAKDLESQPSAHVLATMQGRMAGVEIIQETGVPGGGFNIKIRGQNSLRSDGNSPLYVIDGVPYSSEDIGSFLTSNTLYPSMFSPLNSINPESIETIEVLKDADATAIYGSRGANGVVLITTKKGKDGKTKISLNTSAGIGKVSHFIDLMDTEQYLKMRALAFENDGIIEFPYYAYDLNGTWDAGRYTDWQKELIGGTAEMNSLNATVSGGSEFTQFIAGANYNFQSTVFPGKFNYKKSGVFMNVSHKSIDNRFSFSFSGNYNTQNNYQPSTDLTVISRNLPPNAPALYDDNGELNWENNTWTNPLANFKGVQNSITNDLITNMVLSYQLFPYLEFKASGGFTDTRHFANRTAPSTMFNPSFGLGPEYSALFLNEVNRQSWILEPQLSFDYQLWKGDLKVLVGTSFQQQDSRQMTQYGIGFTSNDLIHNLASASMQIVALSKNTSYKYQAIYGRINYNWEGRYILNLTGRRDGSSRFGPGNQFAYFGAAGFAWVFSNENFLYGNRILSFGKLRGSYGTSGNDQIGDYQYLDTYSSGGVYQGNTGLSPTRIFNPHFRWETNNKFETGLELGFFKDRLFVTGSYYLNRSSNQLVGTPLPGTTGFTTMQANLDAVVENKGFEFSLRTINLESKDLSWTTNLNLTFPKTRLVSFPGLQFSGYKELYRIGEPINIELVYHFLGTDPETGVYQFEDLNGDGQITSPEDKQIVADLSPVFYGGIQNEIRYRRFNLNFLFQFTKQKSRAYLGGTPGTMSNQPSDLVQSWMYPGQNTPTQIFTTGVNQEAVRAHSLLTESDGAIVDGSFIRLKNISLSYQMPLSMKELKCRIYVESQNLLTFTSYKYGDPEFSQLGFLPPLRVISAGLQLTF